MRHGPHGCLDLPRFAVGCGSGRQPAPAGEGGNAGAWCGLCSFPSKLQAEGTTRDLGPATPQLRSGRLSLPSPLLPGPPQSALPRQGWEGCDVGGQAWQPGEQPGTDGTRELSLSLLFSRTGPCDREYRMDRGPERREDTQTRAEGCGGSTSGSLRRQGEDLVGSLGSCLP